MENNLIIDLLKSNLGENIILSSNPKDTPQSITIGKENLLAICRLLYSHPELYFDSLSCVTGIDNGLEKGTMEVVYNFYSIPFNHHLMLKVVLQRTVEEFPTIDSVCSIWRTANWHEREIFDLLGIQFTNHPDLRRILMPADWQGYPLRKDYQDPETYRGISIKN